jgi:cell division septum initiation protein DivIVA
MNQPDPQFRLVMRGYDPADVDRVISGLQQRAVDAEASAAENETRWKQAKASAAEIEPPEPPTFEHLGERVGQILALADEEARELRERAQAETEEARKLAEQAAVSVRDDADQYADHRRRDADAEGARVLADARRAADEERDAAERDAAALRQEGEAVFEQQRANAAKAAADFETTLAERRERTTFEFREQQAATQAQLEAMMQRVEEARVAAQQEQEAAEAQARRIVMEAEERAAALVNEARATADRVRTESDRELAAATQRRDSINAQLTNVRQMLATLTGSAAGFALEPLRATEEPAPEAESDDRSPEPEREPEHHDQG